MVGNGNKSKSKKIVFVCLVFVLAVFDVFSFYISDYYEDYKETREEEKLKVPFQTLPDGSKRRCTELGTLEERVRCRLVLGVKRVDFPESCKGLSNSSLCLGLFDRGNGCFDLTGREKTRCFRKISNDKREYLVLLLEELKRYVVYSLSVNAISLDDAVSIIVRIEEVQRDIFLGKNREMIVLGVNDILLLAGELE